MPSTRIAALLATLLSMATATLPAQIVKNVANFDGTNGGNPRATTLAQGLNGQLYGTTWEGGASALGVVFKLKGGTLIALHSFTAVPPDGAYPSPGLVLGTNGKFYGTTESGGKGAGTVYRISPKGTFATLYSFAGADGYAPEATLIQGTNGKFYGTTEGGGSSGGGTVFKMSPAGVLQSLYSFPGPPDGLYPFAPLVQGSDGKFYGTTEDGGGNPCNCGTVFRITPAGKEKVLYSFGAAGDFSDGAKPVGGLVQGLDGNFYGTTSSGGCQSGCGGTVFKITPAGVLTTLHTFTCYPGDGCSPFAGLTLGSDGNFYGTTFQGGSQAAACNCGTVYRIAPGGSYKSLYSFTNGTDGRNPWGGIFQATNGLFYGTTIAGGSGVSPHCFYDATQTCGTIFKFSRGLSPFVIDLPRAGKVTQAVRILGNKLGTASAVSFNGIPAAFAIISSTEIDTSVPAGATSGYVTVTIASGTLSSNVPFQVLP